MMIDAKPRVAIRTVLLAIPLGEAVRNVLRTDTFRLLKATPGVRIVIASQAADDPAFRQEFSGHDVQFETLRTHAPSLFERGLEAFRLAMLHRHSSTVRVMARPGHADKMRLMVPLATAATRVLGPKRANLALGWLNIKLARSNQLGDLFARHRPDLVVVSRVLSFSADYLVLKEAVRQKVPVIALASSWDNFTSKGFFPFGIERVVVWNDVMREEARQLFGFPDSRIVVAGIPRFDDLFRRNGFRSRHEFMSGFGFDPERPLITYTTGHHRLGWPHQASTPEPKIVAALVDAIASGRITSKPQLLIRLHPQANPDDFSQFAQIDFIRLHVPGRGSLFPDRDLSLRENVLLGETMDYSDVVLNIASTITIDAAVFDTPVICVGIDVDGPRAAGESVRRFYDFEHYRKLAACGGYRRADTVASMVEEVNAYLADPARDRDGRARIVAQQCAFTDGLSGQRVATVILSQLGLGSREEVGATRSGTLQTPAFAR